MTHKGGLNKNPFEGHQFNQQTGGWETEVNGVFQPASSKDNVALKILAPGGVIPGTPSGTLPPGATVPQILAAYFTVTNQGNGTDTEDEALDLGMSGAKDPDSIVAITRNNRWFFARKEDVPPTTESWSVFENKPDGKLHRINSRTGETELIEGLGTGRATVLNPSL